MPVPVVAIIGRPNVGKSTLFNRMIGKRLAIVDETPGVTRDRIYGRVNWEGVEFDLVDTGGLAFTGDDDVIRENVHKQAQAAVQEADLIIFVVDGREGVTPADEDVAELVRHSRKPAILVANKAEGNVTRAGLHLEFYKLGLGDPFPVSAAHGSNVSELLDRIKALLPEPGEVKAEKMPSPVRVAVVGRPNVGKSSFVNALLGEERSIVTPVPGTTRDIVDSPFSYKGWDFIIIDTAGIRRKSRIVEALEYYSVKRALSAIDRSDVVIFMLDATLGVREQETKIAGYIKDAGKASVIAVNKWDLITRGTISRADYEKAIRDRLIFIAYSPVVFMSVKRLEGTERVMDEVQKVYFEYSRCLEGRDLEFVMYDAMRRLPPPRVKGKRARVFGVSQVDTKPPRIALDVDHPEGIEDPSYLRYLENRLREAFGFYGTPVVIFARQRERGKGKGEAKGEVRV